MGPNRIGRTLLFCSHKNAVLKDYAALFYDTSISIMRTYVTNSAQTVFQKRSLDIGLFVLFGSSHPKGCFECIN